MNTIVAVSLTGFFFVLPTAFYPGMSRAHDSWADSIAINGDVRLRYESIDEDGSPGRDRGRFRARLGLTTDVNDKVKAVIQFATGGDNPVSTNQSFDGGFSRKDVGLDLAYIDWSPNGNTHVYGGKMRNPFHRAGGNALVWDSDLNPEGVAIDFDANGYFGTVGVMFVEERPSLDDSLLLAIQGGYTLDVSDGFEVTAGMGYFSYSATIGHAPFFDGRARGNSIDMRGDLVLDYNELELFAVLKTKVDQIPLQVFLDFIQNSGTRMADNGFSMGATIGRSATPGTWQASWVYQDLEADAVIATFTDSDFGGGGTDVEGHVLKGRYVPFDNWTVSGTFFINEVDAFIGNKHDYDRMQLDLEFKF